MKWEKNFKPASPVVCCSFPFVVSIQQLTYFGMWQREREREGESVRRICAPLSCSMNKHEHDVSKWTSSKLKEKPDSFYLTHSHMKRKNVTLTLCVYVWQEKIEKSGKKAGNQTKDQSIKNGCLWADEGNGTTITESRTLSQSLHNIKLFVGVLSKQL